VQRTRDDPQVKLIDARTPDRYAGRVEPIDPVAGHVPGAINRFWQANLRADGRFKPAHELRDEFRRLLGETNAVNVVHMCGSGVTACHNLFAMTLAGLPGGRLYPGSWSEWCADAARPVARDSYKSPDDSNEAPCARPHAGCSPLRCSYLFPPSRRTPSRRRRRS